MSRAVRLGAACWLLVASYFAAQPVVAAAWSPPYSYAVNTISDLGNATCGAACSPRHALMNAAFVLTGLASIAGALLSRRYWPPGRLATAGLICVGLAGAGGILVGLAPADVNVPVHVAGAALQFPGAVGPLLLGLATVATRPGERAFSIALGLLGTVCCLLFLTGAEFGIGRGGVERLAFDPLSVWKLTMAVVILARAGAPGPGSTASGHRRG
ncbi:putative membrane protein [Allocatelliglobosispora scoriae]|uniref:Putative membrane protein n=1 Tax=Allocatelliglobosispora scoriae TaxID=643052 RepID=A0A841BLX3_9ACTN|nr:DUF998 domain-containing protein [Allocatelliglobosispora scoriae]MBB5867861.1 putative membrane protein [Allocatelliglobosispora scoriae]